MHTFDVFFGLRLTKQSSKQSRCRLFETPNGNIFRVTGPLCGEFYVFFDLRLNNRFSKQSWGWWFDTPPRSLWRHRNEWWLRKRRPHGCYWWLGAYLALGLIPPSRWPMLLEWRHNEHDGVFNRQPYYCFLNRSFRCRSKKTSKLRVTGLCAWNSQVSGQFPAQRDNNAENASIWWRHQMS